MTLEWDKNQAKTFTDLHEDIPNNEGWQKKMDLHNNFMGRYYAGFISQWNVDYEEKKEAVRDKCQQEATRTGTLWTKRDVT